MKPKKINYDFFTLIKDILFAIIGGFVGAVFGLAITGKISGCFAFVLIIFSVVLVLFSIIILLILLQNKTQNP